MKIVLMFLIVSACSHSIGGSEPNEIRKIVKSADIGVRVIIQGEYGRIGQKHRLVGIVVKTGKLPSPEIKVIQVDGVRKKPRIWGVPSMPKYILGTIVEFEAVEMGRLERIGLLSNPPGVRVGEIGCRLFLDQVTVLSTEKAKPGSNLERRTGAMSPFEKK